MCCKRKGLKVFYFSLRPLWSATLLALLLLLASAPGTAAVRASLDRNTVYADDIVILTIEGDTQSSGQQPDLSPLEKDFEVLGTRTSSQVRIFNGRLSKHTNLFFDKSIDNLLKAKNAFKEGKNVCLFLSAKSLKTPTTISLIPNHWVAMRRHLKVGTPRSISFSTSAEEIKDKKFDLEVFTWGLEAFNMNKKQLSLYEFSDYYFGYVVAS